MSLFQRTVRRILDLMLVALFGLSALLLAAGIVLPNLGREMIIIGGGSMAPAIPNGAAVIVDKTATSIQVGDVVTIRIPTSGAVFTHRVIEIVGDGSEPALRTQGDANEDPDATPSPQSWVIGRVDYSVPSLGSVAAALQSGTGRAGLISLLLIVLALRWFGGDPEESGESKLAGREPGMAGLR